MLALRIILRLQLYFFSILTCFASHFSFTIILTSQLIVGYKYLPLYNLCTLLKNFFRVHPRPILTQLGFALKFRCFFMTCVHACCAKLFQSCLTLCDPVDSRACQAPLSIGFSVKNTGMGCHALLQGIFLTQGSNSCLFHLLHWQTGSWPLVPITYCPDPTRVQEINCCRCYYGCLVKLVVALLLLRSL